MNTVERVVTIAAAFAAISTANGAIVNGGIFQFASPASSLDPLPPQLQSTLLGEESFAYVDRTHELTAARVDGTGALTTADTGTLVPMPSYLLGLEYVANANDNRTAGTANDANSYILTYIVDRPTTAYLLLDNRLNGAGSNVSNPNTSDPNLGGSLAWVTQDGWQRVNTGIFPGGKADYVGIDEGGTVAGPGDRTHHDAGAGVGLNNFFAIYKKDVVGSFQTKSIRMAAGSGNMYIVAVNPVPEPGTWAMIALGLGFFAFRNRRQS